MDGFDEELARHMQSEWAAGVGRDPACLVRYLAEQFALINKKLDNMRASE